MPLWLWNTTQSKIYCAKRKPSDSMRIIVIFFVGTALGLIVGVSLPTLSITKFNLPSINLSCIQQKFTETISSQDKFLNDPSKIWVPTNPRGAERLAPGIVKAESDFFLRKLWGLPSEDFTSKPKYLMTFTVGYEQRMNIDAAVKKLSENFTIVLFHYDGRTTEWDEFEWSKRAIHISVHKQTKWWYAKRFLHPDIVAPYEYIFMWDEDLGVEHFNAEEYIKLVRKHKLEISQPGLEQSKGAPCWNMTKRREGHEVHKEAQEKPGKCKYPLLPPCAAFVEIMAPVFSRAAWRCVWHMIQNEFVHGWGLDFAFRKCVEPAHEKIGVVDAQWIVHQGVPSLGNQGEAQAGKTAWRAVKERCGMEWRMFQGRLTNAERSYYKSKGINYTNLLVHN
ncbi:hypothetical protein HN51_013977 [Arachis hypogaea]|uniref:Lysine ketoglutarate reductase trans-splicing protein n=1 Tax=Arachis hypogaea TaxID=3818 RepID=A0A445DN00_ARAHY|nr:uncharacterized protein LOC107631693 isoform X1 [Arachis ipaensis]XP_025639411.1 uncharacterized protein LOC112734356 isoform X1 [Arachis hypogaea]QHO59836.1 uncharacterized protein DS421_3g102320 [Arachis hypogaea]RYR64544.1 hypothetical protein Ahy_A03g010633 isoform D [Arachis hypogaea]